MFRYCTNEVHLISSKYGYPSVSYLSIKEECDFKVESFTSHELTIMLAYVIVQVTMIN